MLEKWIPDHSIAKAKAAAEEAKPMWIYILEAEKISVSGNFGWMIGIVYKSTIAGGNPLEAVICKFPAALYGKHSLFSLNDVIITS